MNTDQQRRAAGMGAALARTVATAAAGLAAAGLTVAAAPAPLKSQMAQHQFLQQHMANTRAWKPMFMVKPPGAYRMARRALLAANPPGVTVPYWSTQITSPLDGQTYNVSMIGSSPYAPTPINTNVTYVPVVLRIHLSGFVIDPTAVSHCDSQSAARRFFNSPIFRPTVVNSNGVNVSAVPGGTQLISAFQRANFWNAVKGTAYGVTLVPSRLSPIVVDWSPTNPTDFVAGVSDNCGGVVPVPVVEINEFDTELQAIAAAYAHPNQVPVTLSVDTAIYIGTTSNCCVLGYHNAIPSADATGTQLYATGAYFDTNAVFGPTFADTTIWTHELAEMFDDPFVQNIGGIPGGVNNDLTPAWGHTGQQGGCQNNLEAGDPLTPNQFGNYPNFPVPGVGGFTYHQQDLPFHDWFYRTPSSSTGGKYSMKGIFTAVQGVCS